MTLLGRKIQDKRLLMLIGRYLRAGAIDNQFFQESREGVPQGGPLSPLLANIMLDPLDKELEKRGHKFARYADDFTILVKSPRAGERVLRSISRYLQNRLKLVVNTTKSHIVKVTESKFLGFTFRSGRIQWHDQTLQKFKQEVRRLTNRNWGVSMKYQLFKLSQYLLGLDQLLWHRQLLSTLCRSGSLDSAQSENGLLETVAKATNQSQKSDEIRCSRTSRCCLWHY